MSVNGNTLLGLQAVTPETLILSCLVLLSSGSFPDHTGGSSGAGLCLSDSCSALLVVGPQGMLLPCLVFFRSMQVPSVSLPGLSLPPHALLSRKEEMTHLPGQLERNSFLLLGVQLPTGNTGFALTLHALGFTGQARRGRGG